MYVRPLVFTPRELGATIKVFLWHFASVQMPSRYGRKQPLLRVGICAAHSIAFGNISFPNWADKSCKVTDEDGVFPRFDNAIPKYLMAQSGFSNNFTTLRYNHLSVSALQSSFISAASDPPHFHGSLIPQTALLTPRSTLRQQP